MNFTPAIEPETKFFLPARDMGENQFTLLCADNSEWYNLTVRGFKKNVIQFRDAKKLLPFKFEEIRQSFNLPEDLKIKNGDILAITTHIKGLDVVHVGFAIWKGEKLHLLHASSNAMKVIEDPQSLYEYSKNKKAHTGVRAIRIMD